jgi:predicted ABC-type ATPase
MPPERPHLIVLAGPNGAGKTTVSAELLRGALGVHEFVNADTIARGLSESTRRVLLLKPEEWCSGVSTT